MTDVPHVIAGDQPNAELIHIVELYCRSHGASFGEALTVDLYNAAIDWWNALQLKKRRNAMSEPTYRCGWRVVRPVEIDARLDQWGSLQFPKITVQRGEFRAVMDPRGFDAMSDEEFADWMSRCYREHAFAQLQRDLAILARQLIGELSATDALIETDVPIDDVKAALYRWQRAERDTQEPTP